MLNSKNFRSLTVYGSRAIYSLSLPPQRGIFNTTNFILLSPGDFRAPQPQGGREDSQLSVLMDPELYSPHQIAQLPRPLWLWSAEPLMFDAAPTVYGTPQLGAKAESIRNAAMGALEAIPEDSYDALVVSHVESQSYLESIGRPALISPPPVSEAVFQQASMSRESSTFGTLNPVSEYSELYFSSLEVQVEALERGDSSIRETNKFLDETTFGINIPSSVTRRFTFEAALHLASGHTLISEPLMPLHGLEAGLDYFEVTSPSELLHVTNYLARNPKITKLMAFRGRQKAFYFSAERVYRNVLRSLDR
jgi:hypothetical protein